MRSFTILIACVFLGALGSRDARAEGGASAAPPWGSPQRDGSGEGQRGPDSAPLRLTLDAALRQALEGSHRVAELRARVDSARAIAEGRHAADRPQVSVQAGYTRTNHVQQFGVALPGRPLQVIYPDIPDNYRTRLDVQWPIYSFGRTAAFQRLAEAEAEASAKDVEVARADLRLEVTRAFWALVTAREAARVVDESVKRMDASLEDVRNRQKVGLVPPNDVLSVQAQRSRQQMLAIQAHNQVDVVTSDLARLLGVPADTRIEPDGALDAPPAAPVDPASLAEQARQARPERQALTLRVTEARQRSEAARAGRRPMLAVGGGVDYARPNPRIFPRIGEFRESWDASVNFSWVVWDGGRVRADVADAAAGQRAIAERLAELDRTLESDVRQRWLDLESSRAAVTSAGDAVAAAAEARRVVGDRFANGVATSTDVLDAQVALLQAQLDRTQALANVKLAEARLNRALGR